MKALMVHHALVLEQPLQVWIKKLKVNKKVREKSRECHNHKPQPFPDPKRKRKPTNLNKHKPNKRTKSTKISFLFPKRGNRNTKRTEKHKNKITHGKTYNKSPRRINHKATLFAGWILFFPLSYCRTIFNCWQEIEIFRACDSFDMSNNCTRINCKVLSTADMIRFIRNRQVGGIMVSLKSHLP